MKKAIFLLPILALMAFKGPDSSLVHSTELKSNNPCNLIETVYQNGETLTMEVYYNWRKVWVSAGECTFRVREATVQNRPTYHITAFGRTKTTYDWIYKVRDRYETYVDKETLLPLRYSRDVNEGGYKFQYAYEFDRQKQVAKSTYVRKGNTKKTEVSFEHMCTQDILSAIFYTRCMDFSGLEPGDVIPMPLVLDAKEYKDLYVRFLGREVLETDYGKFNTIKFAPLLVDGTIFEGGEKMTIWATDDKNRIPLKVESPLTVGHIKAFLKSSSGVKYPVDSKIN